MNTLHAEAREYVLSRLAGRHFNRVIEVGGADVNGSIREDVSCDSYTSIDPIGGPGIDVARDAIYWIPPEPVDLVICMEVLEHCSQWPALVTNMAKMLRPGGELVLTCATDARAPHAADGSSNGPHSGEWYRNVSLTDFQETVSGAGLTVEDANVHRSACDLYAHCSIPSIISLLLPTRNRLPQLKTMIQSVLATATRPDLVEFIIYVANIPESQSTIDWLLDEARVHPLIGDDKATLTVRWNMCAAIAQGDIFGMAADDNIFHTAGWDDMVRGAFRAWPDRIGLVHGDDGVWHGELSGTSFVHRNWYNALGYVFTPLFKAWCVDVWNQDIATTIGRRTYLPELYIESPHQDAGKAAHVAPMDETHELLRRTMIDDATPDRYAALLPQRQEDINKLRAVIYDMPRVTACFITHIPDQDAMAVALGSIQGCVDAIHVCVTDPSPQTIALPQYDVPIKFSNHPWNDSFSAARNKSLEGVDTEWCLYIDSDDVVLGGTNLHRMMMACPADMDAIAVKVRSEHSNGTFIENWQPRLFRAGLKFRGRIHEQLYDPAAPSRVMNMWAQHEVSVQHTGYVCSPTEWERRMARNKRLMELDMEDDPTDFMVPMHYARQEMGVNNPLALEMAEKAYRIYAARQESYSPRVGALLINTLMHGYVENKEWSKAIAWRAKCSHKLASAELLFLYGTALVNSGRIQEGIAAFLRAHEDEKLLRDIGGDAEVWTWKPLLAVSQVYAALAEQARVGA